MEGSAKELWREAKTLPQLKFDSNRKTPGMSVGQLPSSAAKAPSGRLCSPSASRHSVLSENEQPLFTAAAHKFGNSGDLSFV